jgi:predicted MFS family arabinose efflux permease
MFFIIASALGMLALGSFTFVRDVKVAPGLRPQNLFKTIFSLRYFDARFRLFLLSVFIFGLGYMPIALVVLRAQSTTGCCNETVPQLYLISAVASGIVALFAGRLAQWLGRRRTLILGFTLAILGYLTLAYSVTFFVMSIGVILLGAYSGITDGILRAFANKLLESHHLAAGHGLLQATIGVSSLFAGTIGGLIWVSFGSTVAFWGGAGIMLLGLLAFSLVDYRPKL